MQRTLILMADPSAATRSMYGDYFRHHGYEVVEAENAAEAVRLLAQQTPRLVVTELFDDPAWLHAIGTRRWPEPERRTPVILCSTRIDASCPVTPEGIDVDVALAKPVSPRDLLIEADHLLTRPAGAETPP